MLFNSYTFIWLFLPIVWGGFFLAARFRHEAAAVWLALCSLFFYGYWDIHYVPLLLLSIAVNYQISKQITSRIENHQQQHAKIWLITGLIFDLGLLAHYKYTGFFLENWVNLTSSTISIPNIILPLGISFFTFTQIAYLVDCYKGIVKERNPVHYLLFITYFPHLIAGPILHHKQMMPQFAQTNTYRISQENIAVGLTIFAIGMFKKVIIADSFPEYANPVFAVSKHTGALSWQDAWLGVLSYTLQLYFDFSGYSDMAIGLSRLFGIKLPLNFNSPYKSTSMIDFWNRWHMTLSQFLREYLYFTLGGNKLGKARRLINMMITMLLGGLWHGAGWTFIVWGGLHGLFLVSNHLFREIFPIPKQPAKSWHAPARSIAGWCITSLAIVSSMTVFRATSLADAVTILQAMVGISADSTAPIANIVDHADDGWNMVFWVSLIAVFAPNTQEIMSKFQPAWDAVTSNTRWQWRPHPALAILTGLALGLSIVNIGQVSEFLYFQF
ncbi:MAG TPA: MBOAT family protein [Pseudomonadales bacterium]|nr:MBOAT family protein [Pseudomonadales bacterium]